jgi:hypothetical protein
MRGVWRGFVVDDTIPYDDTDTSLDTVTVTQLCSDVVW